MKVLLLTLASLLLIQGSLAALKCYSCQYDTECKEEGDKVDCANNGMNCFYSDKGDNKKEKSCYGGRADDDKPVLKGLTDFDLTDGTKLSGCVNIKKQEKNEQAYKACLCNEDNCNTNDKIKSDMKRPDGDEGKRECYVCGGKNAACSEDDLKEPKTEKCKDDQGNCFVAEYIDDKETKLVRGCIDDNDKTYTYGSIDYVKQEKEGTYYICNKNKCNKDKKTWEDSSVAGMSSSLALLVAGLVSYKLFN